LNDPDLPRIRHYGSQILGVTDWTPQAANRLVDWLCAIDHELSDWTARKISLPDLSQRLQAAAEAVASAAEWSCPDSPSRWAKLFGVSTRTFIRYCQTNKIRHRKISAKIYQIQINDLPVTKREESRSKNDLPVTKREESRSKPD
jgi:hypothetical protein